MPEAKPSVLITGANGFVGSRLCRKFLSEGFHVIGGVRQTAGLSLLADLDLEYRHGDVTRPDSLPAMVTGVDYIIHNAGVVKARRPQTFFDVNKEGTLSLFEAAATHNPGVKKIVYVSSLSAAGPVTVGRPVTEDDPPHPVTVYGQSKLAGERVALSCAGRLNVVVVRPPAVYGPGDREMLAIFKTVYRRIKPYFGDTARRIQLVHVDDLARGIFLATTRPTVSGSVFFVAENRSYSMAELIALLEKGCSRKAYPLYLPGPVFKSIGFVSGIVTKLIGAAPMLTLEKAGELLASWEMATVRAEKDLGFVSQIDFERGARETYDWYRKEGWL
jgi:dihydroflavonol-4-reductase